MTDLLTGAALRERASRALDVPLQRALGVQLLDATDPPAGVSLVAVDLAGNGAGGLHAAALCAACEVAAYLALLPALAGDEHALTVSSAMQLVGAAALGERVEVRGELDRRTRRMAFLSVRAAVDGRVIARTVLTKAIVPFAGGARR